MLLIFLILASWGIGGYWWGRNFITGSAPFKEKTLLQESVEPDNRTAGLPSTRTDMVTNLEGPVRSDAEPTPDLETSPVQTIPEESSSILASMATRSDSNPALPIKAQLGPLPSEGIHETPKKSPETAIPSPKSSQPAENVKGTTKAIPQTQVVTSQPGPSSSASSDNQVKETRSLHDARISKKPATPEPSSPKVRQKQGKKETSLVNDKHDREPAPSEVSKPNLLPTENPMPTPNVARGPLSPQNSHKKTPRYSLTAKQRMTKGKFLIRKRLYEEAVKVLDPLFESQPSQWEPWFWMGTAYLGLRNLEQAETFLMEGLVRDDTVPHLWVQQGLVYQIQEKNEKAIGAFRQAQRLAPDLPEVHLNLAHVLESQGNGPLALKHYRTYLTLTDKALESRSLRKKVLEKIVGLEGS